MHMLGIYPPKHINEFEKITHRIKLVNKYKVHILFKNSYKLLVFKTN